MYIFSQFFILLLLTCLLVYKLPKKLIKPVVFLLTIFILLEIIAIYMLGDFIDYRFYNHLNINDIKGHLFQFKYHILVTFFLFFIFYFFIIFISRKIIFKIPFLVAFLLIVFNIYFLIQPNSIFGKLISIYKMTNVKEVAFNDALKLFNINIDNYPLKENLKIEKKGKNIIVMSLESLEYDLIDEKLTPNLFKLINKWPTMVKLKNIKGANYTAGSLYTCLTGVPALFNKQGNSIFQDATNIRLLNLGDIYQNMGFRTKYIIGNPYFSGIHDMLKIMNFNVINEENNLGKYNKIDNIGLHDYDVFEEAKKQLENIGDNSFAIYLSTINTHFPNGIFDERMKQFIGESGNTLEFSIKSVDYLIGDFLEYLEKKDLLEETAIFIYPDHLAMGPVKSDNERAIYFLSNMPILNEKYINKEITQMDFPRLIHDLSGIKSNAKFISDFESIKEVSNKDELNFVKLNQASLENKSRYDSGFNIKLTDNTVILENLKDNPLHTVPFKSDGILEVTFSDKFQFIEYKSYSLWKDALKIQDFTEKSKLLYLLIDIKDSKINKIYLGNKDNIGFFKDNYKSLIITENEVLSMIESQKLNNINKITYLYDKSILKISSSEFYTSKEIMSEIETYDKKYYLERGLNIIFMVNGILRIENYDTWESEEESKEFLLKIKSLMKNKSFWTIVSHDAFKTSYDGYQEELENIGLSKLSKLDGLNAYISYYNINKEILEFSSNKNVSIVIPSYNFNKSNLLSEINNFLIDKKKLIAHAGGMIDNLKYTESLESLNLNYQKGFRLFELDIIETSDGHFVAMHDWNHFLNITNYKGIVPPSKADFLSQKIYNKYTPLDMKKINLWFKEHSDAILVTDKTNKVKEFSEKFIDKKRLMMELFSVDSFIDAQKEKIAFPLLSYEAIENLTDESKLDLIKELGVKYVALSEHILLNKQKFVRKLNEINVKIYAFDVKDICNNIDQIYGIYVDEPIQLDNLNCIK